MAAKAAATSADIEKGSSFDLSPLDLDQLHVPGREEENMKSLRTYGGGEGLCTKLKSNPTRGIDGSPEDIALRQSVFGRNVFKEIPLECERSKLKNLHTASFQTTLTSLDRSLVFDVF
jgi:hypothetical protein